MAAGAGGRCRPLNHSRWDGAGWRVLRPQGLGRVGCRVKGALPLPPAWAACESAAPPCALHLRAAQQAWSTQHWVCLRTLHGRHDDTTWPACVALSPDGSLLASASTGMFGASTIKVGWGSQRGSHLYLHLSAASMSLQGCKATTEKQALTRHLRHPCRSSRLPAAAGARRGLAWSPLRSCGTTRRQAWAPCCSPLMAPPCTAGRATAPWLHGSCGGGRWQQAAVPLAAGCDAASCDVQGDLPRTRLRCCCQAFSTRSVGVLQIDCSSNCVYQGTQGRRTKMGSIREERVFKGWVEAIGQE